MTFVTWNRIEPTNQAATIEPGLAAPLADPLWLLGRQWQLGELTAEDAGTPVAVSLDTSAFWIDRLTVGSHERPLGPELPLEAYVEPEPPGPPDLRLRLSSGRDLLLALEAVQPAAAQALRTFARPAASADRLEQALVCAVGARAVDAEIVAAAIAVHGVDTVAGQLGAATAVVTAWHAGYLQRTGRAAPSAWDGERAAYRFSLAAAVGDRDVVLDAADYRGGTLDWCDFSARTIERSAGAATPKAPVTLTRTRLPAPLEFAGGPARRYFEIESAGTSFTLLAGAPPDIATALLLEVALVFGGDWFVVPAPFPVGTLARVDRVTVIDTFGDSTVLSGRLRSPGWRMFECADPTDAAANMLTILPTTTTALEGQAIESIALVRDEAANVVWAIEDIAADALGLPRTIDHRPPVLPSGPTYTYVPYVPPPASWFPLVRRGGATAHLVGATLHGATTPREPRGRMLAGFPAIDVLADDVSAEGLRIERRWQVAFGRGDGTGGPSRAIWISRNDRIALSPASSNVAADQVLPPVKTGTDS